MRKSPFFKVIVSLLFTAVLTAQVLPGLALASEGPQSGEVASSTSGIPQSGRPDSGGAGAGASSPLNSMPVASAPAQSAQGTSMPESSVASLPQSASATPSSGGVEENTGEITANSEKPPAQREAEGEAATLGAEALAAPIVNFSDLLENVKVEYGTSGGTAQQVPSTLDKDSTLWVTYYLKDITLADLDRLVAAPYTVDVPTYLKTATGTLGSIEVKATDLGRVGTLSFVNGAITFTFDITNLNNHRAEFPVVDLYFAFGANLDMNEVGGRQDIHLQVDKDAVITVNVKDNTPKDAEITDKKGVYNPATGAVDWTVTLSPEIARFVLADPVDPANPDAGALAYIPYAFEDELGSDQYYLPGSFAIGGNPPSPAAGFSYDETGHRLRCTLVGGLPAGATLTYSTLPEKSLLYTYDAASGQYTVKTPSAGGLLVQNKALLKKTVDAAPISQKSATGKFEVKAWLEKSGVETDFQSRTITWKLVLNTNGCSFDDITVYDNLPAGLSFTGVGDIQVTAADGSTPTLLTNGGFTGQGVAGQNTNEQKLLTLENPSPTVYTITYKTSFPQSVLGTGTTNYENKTWLNYTWKVGPGDAPVPVGAPAIQGSHKVNSCYVAKTGTYDSKTHRITWKLEVNRNRNAVANLVVEDWVDYNSATAAEEDKQILLPSTIQLTQVNGGTPPVGISMNTVLNPANPKQKQFTLTFTGLSPTDCVLVEYQTEVKNPAFYANNASEAFHNQAVVRNGLGTTPLQTVNASQRFESKMMEKSATGYQYDTHTLGWEVQVNKNELAYLPKAKFTDVLPPHLQLDVGSLRLDGATPLGDDPIAGGGNYYTLSPEADGSKTLEVFLQDGLDTATPGLSIPYVNAKHTVRYNTKLDVDNAPGFSFVTDNGKNFTAVNTAQLQSDLYGPVVARAEKSIPNQSFDKNSQLDRAGLQVQYTIAINQAMANMGEGPFVLLDTLPQGVLLDVESVQLWPAKVNRDGKLQKDGSTPKSGTKLEVEGNLMRFSLNLTTLAEQSRAWLVTYSVDIVDGAGSYNLTNHASMGLTSSGLGASDELHFNISAAEAGAANNTRRDLKVTRQDEKTKTPLPGAVYELYAYYPGTTNRYLVATATTDENGNLTFKGLKIGREYLVKEVVTPPGYPPVPEQSIVIQRGTEGDLQKLLLESTKESDSSSSSLPGSSSIPSPAPSTSVPASVAPSLPTVSVPLPVSSSSKAPAQPPATVNGPTALAQPTSPQTGDTQVVWPILVLLLGSAGLLCTTFILRVGTRRRRKKSGATSGEDVPASHKTE